MDDVIGYKPQKPVTNAQNPWAELIARICVFDDDGHAAKLVRALAQGERVSEPFGDDRNFRVKDDMWLQLGNMGKFNPMRFETINQFDHSCGLG